MIDDFNTTEVFGRLFALIRKLNRKLDQKIHFTDHAKEEFLNDIKVVSRVVGVFGSEPAKFLERQKRKGLKSTSISEAEIQSLIEERKKTRLSKDFKRADEIRQELASKGVLLKDNPDGSTSWEIKR